MNQYLTHVFDQFTMKSSSKEFNTLVKEELIELRPVDLTKIYKQVTTSKTLFNQLNLLMAKGVIKYSPANCTVELALPNVMVYQRMFKMAYFAQENLDSNVGEFVNEWVEQGLENGIGFPVMFDKKKLMKAFSTNSIDEPIVSQAQQTKKKSKSKGKHQIQQTQQKPKQQTTNQYNYHKLIYEYKSRQKVVIPQKIQQPTKNGIQQQKKSKPTNKTNKQSTQNHDNTNDFESFMLNVEQLTRLMQLHMFLKYMNSRLGLKEKKMGLFEFLNSKDREQAMQQIKYQKLQQFIAQILSPDCLLVFNLIKKYPYITEKQLIKQTMLEVLQTRSSINKLVQKGLLNFYNQNARTIVYKVVQNQILEKKYVDTLARGMVNLALAGERVAELAGLTMGHEKVKTKLIEMQCEMQRLDDVMILFGW